MGAHVHNTLGTSSGRAPTRCTFSLCRSHLRFTTIARFAQERVRRAPDHLRRRIRFRMAGSSAPKAPHPWTTAFATSLSHPRCYPLPRPLHPPLLDCNPRGTRLRRYLLTWWALGSAHVSSESATGSELSMARNCLLRVVYPRISCLRSDKTCRRVLPRGRCEGSFPDFSVPAVLKTARTACKSSCATPVLRIGGRQFRSWTLVATQ